MLQPFENTTQAGNEKAIRRGSVVPPDAVNLAYVNVPELNPVDNLVIVDTSRIVEENAHDTRIRRKIYYADPVGMLVDRFGNSIIEDQYPAVTDVFTVDEDWSIRAGKGEYTPRTILPYVHVSRYFHVDHSGLTLGSDLMDYDSEAISVVDKNGHDYVDAKGRRRYRIRITAAHMAGGEGDSWAYRVHAYVDNNNPKKTLYLQYNKVELAPDATLKKQLTGYREIINPQNVFEYRPEETEVIDPVNRNKSIYSSQQASYKAAVVGNPSSTQDGYQVYVPRKAVPDPRIFQLFRWRINTTFTQTYKTDPERQRAIKCGVIVTTEDLKKDYPSRAPFAFLNLARSKYNATGMSFINPAKGRANGTGHSPAEQNKRSYWLVNIDTADLSEYDVLIWAPNTLTYNFGPYTQKLHNYMSQHNGTVFIDTNNYTDAWGLGVQVTHGVFPKTGKSRMDAGYQPSVVQFKGSGGNSTVQIPNKSHTLIDGLKLLGGWKINDGTGNNEWLSLSWIQPNYNPGYSQHLTNVPENFVHLFRARHRVDTTAYHPMTIIRGNSGGRQIISCLGHLYTVSALLSHLDGSIVSGNAKATLSNDVDYAKMINSQFVEGSMKFLFNVALLALRLRSPMYANADEYTKTTSWTFSSPWKSSWVINADVLSGAERQEFGFSQEPADIVLGTESGRKSVWKRKLSNSTIKAIVDNEIKAIAGNPATANQVLGTRQYTIEITNPHVKTRLSGTVTGDTVTYDVTNDSDRPAAWTEAYTPEFSVPPEIGPHVIREERVAGDYERNRAANYSYGLGQPYAVQVLANYIASEENTYPQVVNWTATGTATETIVITEERPPVTTSTTSDVTLSWWDDPKGGTRSWRTSGSPDIGMNKPVGIDTWQERNYYTNAWGPGDKNWPYWGVRGTFKIGSSGEKVMFIQDAMNRFDRLGFFNSQRLKVDGYYGQATYNVVKDFQQQLDARYKDGIVDAETWFLIGSQVIRAGNDIGGINLNNYTRFYRLPKKYMAWENISNNDRNTWFAKQSWHSGGPSVIWDMLMVTFDTTNLDTAYYNFHGVSIWPYVEGDYGRMMVRSIDVRKSDQFGGLNNYNSRSGRLLYMPHRPRDNQKLYIPFGPYTGDTIIMGIGQDRGAGRGWGSARMFGIRDIKAHARVTTTTTRPRQTLVTQNRPVTISDSGTTSVRTTATVYAQPNDDKRKLSNIKWTGLTLSPANPKVSGTITQDGRIDLTHASNGTTLSEENVVMGHLFPFPTPRPAGYPANYHSMDENGRLNGTAPETGRISKADGIKLLCTREKKPIGFPGMPTATGGNEYQRHYVSLELRTRGTGSKVTLGFYDILRKEFITSANGRSEMSYIEYMKRGPQNIFIGIISEYDESTQRKLVPVNSAPVLPFKWAMPVYGVQIKEHSRISLQPLPRNLGSRDLWPVTVREGEFNRYVTVRSATKGLPPYLSKYQGKEVRAFYGIPEAKMGAYSTLYGPPHIDVLNEEPTILDDNLIRVRQAPISMVTEPTANPGPADPVRPIFKVYTRATRSAPWVQVPWNKIDDWNVSTGEIYLRDRLKSNDPQLVRVDYVTTRRHYYFKKFGSDLLNMNMYPGHSRDTQDKPLHIYIVPEYIIDKKGNVIPGSVNQTTLRATVNPRIFDPSRPAYNPFAVQLGVIYTSAALDPDDLDILDTRTRGGGIPTNTDVNTVSKAVKDALTYWDVSDGSGTSYQNSGFIIIRLDPALRADFSEAEIRKVINRNITAGVKYKIEDLQGKDWA